MKKMIFALMTMLTLALSTQAMSYEQARNEALFLTDKMAYELNLSDSQYEAAYEINLDYLMSITGYDDVNGIWWERRNQDLRYILYSWQWDAFCAASYFFRPLYWQGGYWHFGIYARYPRRDYFYFGTPHFFASYRGGHSWRANGGRSFYEHRRDMFRPGHVERTHHVGMRNGWDRGDYRGLHHGNSSTRVTVGNRTHGGNGQGRIDGRTNGGNSQGRIDGRTHGNNGQVHEGNRPNGNSRSFGNGNTRNNFSTPRSSNMGTPRSSSVGTPRSSNMGTPRNSSVSTPRSSSVSTPRSSSVSTPRSSSVSTPRSSSVSTPRSSSVSTPRSIGSSHSSGTRSSGSHADGGGDRGGRNGSSRR